MKRRLRTPVERVSGGGAWCRAAGVALVNLAITLAAGPGVAADPPLELPALNQPAHLRLASPVSTASQPVGNAVLVERNRSRARLPMQSVPAIAENGAPRADQSDWLVTVPPRTDVKGSRRFTVARAERRGAAESRETSFRFAPVDALSLGLWEGDRPVLVYNHGVMLKPGVPADRARSSYLHPIYGLDGEVLTDDFPADHHHHRGLFWSWPHVGIGGREYDLWMLKGIAHRFEKWLGQTTGPIGAVLGVENGWYVGERKVMQERVWLTVFAASDGARAMDVNCTWIPVDQAISLAGAEGKSYGGMTLRYAPGTNTVITTPLGNGTNDLYITRLPWADLSRLFDNRPASAGAALFVAPDHPDYPPTWLTRHYGVLCLGWPGVTAKTFPAGVPIHCRYRVWVHRGVPAQAALQSAYDAYAAGLAAGSPRH